MINWRAFGKDTHLNKLLRLFQEMGQPFGEPFQDGETIIVVLGDNSAFIFDMNGKAINE